MILLLSASGSNRYLLKKAATYGIAANHVKYPLDNNSTNVENYLFLDKNQYFVMRQV